MNDEDDCEDVDECTESQSCLNGACINTQGSFQCRCEPEFELSSEGTICVDERKSYCFMRIYNDSCSSESDTLQMVRFLTMKLF